MTADKRRLRVIGLMSGTSMDGIDAALIETDGDTVFGCGATSTTSYDPEFRLQLRSITGRVPDGSERTSEIVRKLTLAHADAVEKLMQKTGLSSSDIDLIGFHGQTVFHAPDDGITCQIGDAGLLAETLDIDVIGDFRIADVEAGGEGAPLAPVYHVALSRELERPVAVLNVGGVANVTWISHDGGAIAFDTGPGNALIDDWVHAASGAPRDENGRLARSGQASEAYLARLLDNPYFARPVPKSLDRDDFAAALDTISDLSLEDGAATLTAFTAASVAAGLAHLPAPPLRWLVTGGGRHNPSVMAALRAHLNAAVEPVEAVGWDGDALEAQAFGFMAARSLFGLPLTYPQTTGVGKPMPGGRVFRAEAA